MMQRRLAALTMIAALASVSHAAPTFADLQLPAREALLTDLPTLGYIGNPLDPWGATDAPTGYGAGAWTELYAGVPAIANYLFQAEPLTMTTTTWVPREPPT